MNEPHIVFGRKGNGVGKYHVFNPGRREADAHDSIKKWVESLVVVLARIENHPPSRWSC